MPSKEMLQTMQGLAVEDAFGQMFSSPEWEQWLKWSEHVAQTGEVSRAFSRVAIQMAEQILKIGRLADEAMCLAETDYVSQLPNMRAALNALEFAIDQVHWSQEPLAVLMIDGDNLRRFNEVGYAAGDESIRLMGATLRATLRTADFLARWRTGDEFLILLPNTELEGAVQLAERLCKAIETASSGWLFRTSVSIGIAIYPDHGKTMQELLDSAEKAMKEAKRRGKNGVIVAGEPEGKTANA